MHASHRPFFLITVNVEGDHLWSRPKHITTRNADYLQRFQALCARHEMRPTYLASYEMAMAPNFREFGHRVLNLNSAEIGTHLHAWNTPPFESLTENDTVHQPFLFEFRSEVMKQKVAVLTSALESAFGEKMVSHRAGRWAFDERYAQIIAEQGYRVDCSVTPHQSWCHASTGSCADYRRFPNTPYFMDLEDLRQEGHSPLLEVPMTIVPAAPRFIDPLREKCHDGSLPRKILDGIFPQAYWLRPTGRNGKMMQQIVSFACDEYWEHIELTLTSADCMPGGSPMFMSQDSVERLFNDLEDLFEYARTVCVPATLKEFYQAKLGQKA